MPGPQTQPSVPISGSNGPWLTDLEIEADRAEARRRRAAQSWSSYLNEKVRYYSGPHLSDALQKGKTALELFSPAGDAIDASSNYEAMHDELEKGNVGAAAGHAGWAGVSALGLSEAARPIKDATLAAGPYIEAAVAGIGAKTADLLQLTKAKQLEHAGVDPHRILRETGWFKGADNKGGFSKWRYEINDSQARINPKVWQEIRTPNFREWRGSFGELYEHPGLLKAYPDLGDIDATVRYNGDIRRIQGEYGAPSARFNPYIAIEMNRPFKQGLLERGVAHEGTHHVQHLEDFAPGGNPDSGNGSWKINHLAVQRKKLASRANELTELINSKAFAPERIDAARRDLDAVYDAFVKTEDALIRARHTFYHRLGGEVEARNVAKRLKYTQTQRLARPPWETEGTPRHLQTFVIPPNL